MFVGSFFLSVVAKTQFNYWTNWVVRTQFIAVVELVIAFFLSPPFLRLRNPNFVTGLGRWWGRTVSRRTQQTSFLLGLIVCFALFYETDIGKSLWCGFGYCTIGSYHWTHSVVVKYILLHISSPWPTRVRWLHSWAGDFPFDYLFESENCMSQRGSPDSDSDIEIFPVIGKTLCHRPHCSMTTLTQSRLFVHGVCVWERETTVT